MMCWRVPVVRLHRVNALDFVMMPMARSSRAMTGSGGRAMTGRGGGA